MIKEGERTGTELNPLLISKHLLPQQKRPLFLMALLCIPIYPLLMPRMHSQLGEMAAQCIMEQTATLAIIAFLVSRLHLRGCRCNTH